MRSTQCCIVYNGHLRSEKFLYQLRWLERAAADAGFQTKLIGNHELVPAIIDGRCTLRGPYADYEPDFIFFWDKDVRLARHLEKMGFRLFNSASSIEICDDKSRTYEVLANHGLNIPDTLVAPMIYEHCPAENDSSGYEHVIEALGFPLVIKEAFGSFGEQVYLIRNEEELYRKIAELRYKPYVFQRFIASSRGKDIRINVIGDQAVAAMLRKSDTDFRANVTAGGRMYPYTPTEAEKNAAVQCASIIGADFAGVDLLFGDNGEPVVCEVNSNAHFKNIYDCTGIDLAYLMMDYIRTLIKG